MATFKDGVLIDKYLYMIWCEIKDVGWNDHGSGGRYDFTGFYPKRTTLRVDGKKVTFRAAGGAGFGDYREKCAVLYVAPRPGVLINGKPPAKKANYIQKIWADHGTGSNMDGMCIRPQRQGDSVYKSLGDVFVPGYDTSSYKDQFFVLHRDVVNRGRIDWRAYNDSGTGGKQDLSVWFPQGVEEIPAKPWVFYPSDGPIVCVKSHSKPSPGRSSYLPVLFEKNHVPLQAGWDPVSPLAAAPRGMKVPRIPDKTGETVVKRKWDKFTGPGRPSRRDLSKALQNGGWLVRETRRFWKKVKVVNQPQSGSTIRFWHVDSLVDTVTRNLWNERASTKGWQIEGKASANFDVGSKDKAGAGVGLEGGGSYHQSTTVTNHSGFGYAQATESSSRVDITVSNLPLNTAAALWMVFENTVWTDPQRTHVLFKTLDSPTGEFAVSEHPNR